MKSIIEELWYGNLDPSMSSRHLSKEAKELLNYMAIHHETLNNGFSEEQKEVFEKFEDCSRELNDINEREIFTYAFRLGARIAFETMSWNGE